MYKTGLILEGGGMRGIYTAGVLDFFLDKQLDFETVIGVSAGACNACNYISKQRGRNYQVTTDYLKQPEYLSFRNFLKEKSAFGMEFIFDQIPNKLNLFDYTTYHQNKMQLIAVSSDVETGKAVYRPIVNMRTDLDYLRSSMSIPLLSPIIEIDGKKLLDGGISDAIPIRYAQSLGYQKNVLILTRDASYRKDKNTFMPLLKNVFKAYPNFVKALDERHVNYNNTLNLVHMLQQQKQVFIIQPQTPITISSLEKNKTKLKQLYEQGYHDAQQSYDDLLNFLKQ